MAEIKENQNTGGKGTSEIIQKASQLASESVEKAGSAFSLENELARYRERLAEETQKNLEKYRTELEKSYSVKEAKLVQDRDHLIQQFEEKKNALAKREEEIRKVEIVRDEGFADARSKLEQELSEKRSGFEVELDLLLRKRLVEMEKHLEAERQSRLASLKEEIKRPRQQFEDYRNVETEKLSALSEKLTRRQQELDREKELVDLEKGRLKARKERLDREQAELHNSIASGIEDERKKYEDKLSSKEAAYNRLLEELRSKQNWSAVYDQLAVKCGDNPQKFLLELTAKEEKLKRNTEEFYKKAEAEQQKIAAGFENESSERKRLAAENKRLNEQINSYREKIQEARESDARIEEMYRQITFLRQEKDAYETQCGVLDKELQKYRAVYKSAAGLENRISAIEKPYVQQLKPSVTKSVDEITWLKRIFDSCAESGYRFTIRLLYAFHTALKTAEWSSITVLAGVSGTGKSKLPELYSHFGGIYFFSLPVQPNWDSKESMLGFFNTIEGTFDAQPVLRFLAQTQKEKTKDYPSGLKDALNIVLLDEMNLANVELYFAEFLSKLEERNGRVAGQEPVISIKLGSDVTDEYPLKLGRNILWVGTMNQDETTKSLSDKVLDRGIVINFPRPADLKHKKRIPLVNPAPYLPIGTWNSWKCDDTTFVSDWVEKSRIFVEEINRNLGKVGLAIGHRVWQGIEQYMINYPFVLNAQAAIENAKDEQEKSTAKARRDAALKDAFEDQLAQKVMPKLRGIETTGDQRKKCLDPINELLKKDGYIELVEDFANAMKFGNGQFIWNSSNYLNKGEVQSGNGNG
jgi:hypothetical protein